MYRDAVNSTETILGENNPLHAMRLMELTRVLLDQVGKNPS